MLQADLNTSAGLAVLFDLVRVLNTAIDDGTLGEADARAARELFAHFDRVLGVLSLQTAGRCASAGRPGRDRAADRGAPGRAAAPRFRRRRPDPRRARQPRHHPGGWAGRDEVEEKIGTKEEGRWMRRFSRLHCPARRPRELIARDSKHVSPVLHARLSARDGRRQRRRGRGRGRQPVSRLRRRHRRQRHRASTTPTSSRPSSIRPSASCTCRARTSTTSRR